MKTVRHIQTCSSGRTAHRLRPRFTSYGVCRAEDRTMTALTIPTAPSRLARACAALGAAAGRAAHRLLQAWRRRHAAAELAVLDDHLLADIGLTRADLADALSQPVWRDPTRVLARRHDERRQASPAAAAVLIAHHVAPPLVPGADAFAFPPRDPPARLTL
jgi:uncharacterized protein YjiS (DUF1127 family)